MSKITSKIIKLRQALEIAAGKVYVIDRNAFYSNKYKKVVQIYVLNMMIPLSQYKQLHPDTRKKLPANYDGTEDTYLVKEPVLETISEFKLLYRLLEEWNAARGGEADGEGAKANGAAEKMGAVLR